MPVLAFCLYTIQIGCLLGLRFLRHQRKYGRFGLATELAPNLIGGGGILLAGLLFALAPWMQTVGVVRPIYLGTASLEIGLGLWLFGLVGAWWSQSVMESSWRFGVEFQSETTALITHGPFRRVRNPIYSFDLLSLLGLVLICPNIATIMSLLVVQMAFFVQVKYVEEPYLVATHGRSYLLWVADTWRFVPRMRKFNRSPEGDCSP